jgi:SAM-dependent methyltransferase
MLEAIDIPGDVMERSIPAEVRSWVHEARQRVQVFQDRWDRPQIEQFVASDYELVYQTLEWIGEAGLASGRRFLEWGCGFAAVTALAGRLGWDAIGIEAEEELLSEGRRLVADWDQPVELVCGNFLPPGGEALADDPTVPSLGHPIESGYELLGLELDDFDLVFAYPWPGEEEFHGRVFERFAARGALLCQFCGPYDVRLWRKTQSRGGARSRRPGR